LTTRSKPVRIFSSDDNAVAQLAQLMRRSRAEVVHQALAEYLANHREELSRLYEETQSALASGDLERLAQVSAPVRRAEVEAIMADIPA
jgi:RNA polymerase-interacting CarD/CdnL/TRCF family regulator